MAADFINSLLAKASIPEVPGTKFIEPYSTLVTVSALSTPIPGEEGVQPDLAEEESAVKEEPK